MSGFSTLLARGSTAQGFTLIELMVAIAIFVILLSIGVPSFTETIRSNQLTSQANSLITALNVARSEATKRGAPVTACASTDQASCSGSVSWNSGWIVFSDDTGTAGVVDVDDPLLQTWPSVPAGIQVTGAAGFVRYGANGVSDAATTFDLLRPSCIGVRARRITISNTGRVSSQKVACP
jgi:type IV fimbrial biogenesis protein FimT